MSDTTEFSGDKHKVGSVDHDSRVGETDENMSDTITTTSDGGSSAYAQDSFDDAFSNPSFTPSCLIDSFQRHETLLIFDYDDTLFPTSFLSQNGYKLDGPDASPEIQAILDEYSTVVEQTLIEAQQHGQIVIVTNAESGWITLTAQKFMPRLGQLLESYPMISARSTYEPLGILNPYQWKLRAFESVVHEHYTSSPQVVIGKNILSIGDSTHERDAVHQVCKTSSVLLTASSMYPKSVKFMERPDVAQLTRQHHLIRESLHKIVYHVGTLDLCIQCQPDGESQ